MNDYYQPKYKVDDLVLEPLLGSRNKLLRRVSQIKLDPKSRRNRYYYEFENIAIVIDQVVKYITVSEPSLRSLCHLYDMKPTSKSELIWEEVVKQREIRRLLKLDV